MVAAGLEFDCRRKLNFRIAVVVVVDVIATTDAAAAAAELWTVTEVQIGAKFTSSTETV
jgi:hypothetical protein